MQDIYQIDEEGRAVVGASGLFELWYHGANHDGAQLAMDEEIREYNRQCLLHDKREFVLAETSPEAPLSERTQRWLIPEKYLGIDVAALCLERCDDPEGIRRVEEEMALYEERGLIPLLQTMLYMVDIMRENKIVWGVGRGSSVSSYILYLIGIHKINSLKYNLRIEEFLR